MFQVREKVVTMQIEEYGVAFLPGKKGMLPLLSQEGKRKMQAPVYLGL